MKFKLYRDGEFLTEAELSRNKNNLWNPIENPIAKGRDILENVDDSARFF